MTFRFACGSIGTVEYLANGNKSFGKERIEVFGSGKAAVLDDFRSLELVSESKRSMKKSLLGQNKGHRAAWEAFADGIERGEPTIPYEQLFGVTRATFAVMEALRSSEETKI
jgi:predicted dehydrogenase